MVGIGRDFRDRLHFDQRPQELRRFARIEGAAHVAPSTPGDRLSIFDLNVPICASNLNAFCSTISATA
ncbi:MAG: Dyp-type peroxidase domain-containing protein [Nitrobacter sp.]